MTYNVKKLHPLVDNVRNENNIGGHALSASSMHTQFELSEYKYTYPWNLKELSY